MMNSNGKKFIIVSPIEFHFFALELPSVKDEYKLNAIKFMIKSLYPGSMENTAIDYFSCNGKTIAVMIDNRILEKYKSEKAVLISTAFATECMELNGIFICQKDNWLEIKIRTDNKLDVLQSVSLEKEDEAEKLIRETIKGKKYISLPVYIYQGEKIDFNKVLKSIFKEHEINFLSLEDLFTTKRVSKSLIFEKRRNNNIIKILWFTTVFIIVLLCSILFLMKKNLNELEKQKKIIKNDYEKQKSALENISEKPVNNNLQSTEYEYSIACILNEFASCSEQIRLVSFSMTENKFVVELENANALEVYNRLLESKLFYNIQLHQVIPQNNGFEKFSVTGEVKYE